MPVSRRRKVKRVVTPTGKSTTQLLGQFLEQLDQLENATIATSELYLDMKEQLTEISLQVLFIMRNIPIRKKVEGAEATSLVGANGKPVQQYTFSTLQVEYQTQRDTFLALLRQEKAARDAENLQSATDAGSESQSSSDTPGEGDPDTSAEFDAATATKH